MNRREFLFVSSGAALGSSLVPGLALAQESDWVQADRRYRLVTRDGW